MKQKLFLLLLFALCALGINAEVISGSCGEDLIYNLDTSTGVLKIEGTGDMDNYYESPWKKLNVKEVEFSGAITSIGDYAFFECSMLSSVTIPNSVTTIGRSSFSGCEGLTSVVIPNSVETIEEHAFSCCFGLASVTIGNSVTSIGFDAFVYCYALSNVEFSSIESMCSIHYRDEFSNPLSQAEHLLINGKEITEIEIPNTVTSISAYAFYHCGDLTSVIISNSVTSIGDCAFKNCWSLNSVSIPNSVTSIGDYAFCDCSKLSSVSVPNSVISIGKGVFERCSSLKDCLYTSKYFIYCPKTIQGEIAIPAGIETICGRAFVGCTGLTSVTIPHSVTSIGPEAFQNCTQLKSIAIPNSVTNIGHGAFIGCRTLTAVTIPNLVTKVESSLFYDCSNLKTVIIPNSVTSIETHVFRKCTAMTDLYCYAESVPQADRNTFSNEIINLQIHVPASAVDDYKRANYWGNYQIVPLTDQELGIDNVTYEDNADTPIYDLSGRCLNGQHNGINIVSGRKVLVK